MSWTAPVPPGSFWWDASDPVVLQAARGLSRIPVRHRTAAASAGDTLELRAYYNPERRSEVQIVPGLIGVILTLTMSLFTAVAIVRERERGTLELLINTPVRPAELMVGKILPYVFIGLLQVSLILFIGTSLFRVPLRGSLVDLYAASGIFVASTLALGLLISTFAKNQFQAFQMTIFFFLPSLLLLRLHVPFRRHATAGSATGVDPASDPLSSHGTRHHPAGR